MQAAVDRYGIKLGDTYKIIQNARKFQSRLRSRRQVLTGTAAFLLGIHVEMWPHGRTAQYEYAWQKLHEIKQLLLRSPESFASLARDRAVGLQKRLEPQIKKDIDAARLWIYCTEVIRDAGEKGDSDETFNQVEDRAQLVEQLWDTQHDNLNYVYALLTHAHICRLKLNRANPKDRNKYARNANQLIDGACHILDGLCRKEDRILVNSLLHQAVLIKFRLLAFHYRDKSGAKRTIDKLLHITQELDSPTTWVETLREEAGYYQEMEGDLDTAEEKLNTAKSIFSMLAYQPIPTQLSLLRPELEILRIKKNSKLELRAQDYLKLLNDHPSAYHLYQIRNVLAMCGYQQNILDISVPIYTTPLITYLCQENFSLRSERIEFSVVSIR